MVAKKRGDRDTEKPLPQRPRHAETTGDRARQDKRIVGTKANKELLQ